VAAQAVVAVQMQAMLAVQELLGKETLVVKHQIMEHSAEAEVVVQVQLEQLVQLLVLAVLVAVLFQLGLQLLQLVHLVRMQVAVAVAVGIHTILEQTLAVLVAVA
jgi:hypothetical protein